MSWENEKKKSCRNPINDLVIESKNEREKKTGNDNEM